MKREGDLVMMKGSPFGPAYREPVAAALSRSNDVVSVISQKLDATVLKLSGGEIFLLPEFIDALPTLARKYAVVQILTNGTLITDRIIDSLSAIKNIHVQISLDGHLIEMNRYRFRNSHFLSAILGTIQRISSAGIPIEVNSVLTNANTERWFEFAERVSQHISAGTVYPFPVRSHPELLPSKRDVGQFEEMFLGSYLELRPVLPPRAYFEELIRFMRSGKRTRGCHVPHAVVGSSGDGRIDACTCGPVKNLGNVLAEGAGDDPVEKIGKDRCYTDVLKADLSPVCCSDCFTHYDVINLFIEGQVSVAELMVMPFFAVSGLIEELTRIKAEMDRRTAH
jgi:MoaA/NifB/PqqE/SkfB family radical SAM enzyme